MLVKIKYEKVKPTQKTLNNVLKELRIEYPFLEKVNLVAHSFIDL